MGFLLWLTCIKIEGCSRVKIDSGTLLQLLNGKVATCYSNFPCLQIVDVGAVSFIICKEEVLSWLAS